MKVIVSQKPEDIILLNQNIEMSWQWYQSQNMFVKLMF